MATSSAVVSGASAGAVVVALSAPDLSAVAEHPPRPMAVAAANTPTFTPKLRRRRDECSRSGGRGPGFAFCVVMETPPPGQYYGAGVADEFQRPNVADPPSGRRHMPDCLKRC